MFKKDKITKNEQPSEGTKTIQEKVIPLIEKPKICCVDLNESVINDLEKKGYNLFNGKMGHLITIPNLKQHQSVQINLEYTIPKNFHEFDILIMDLNIEQKKEYIEEDHDSKEISKKSILKLICSYPTTLFDPKPLVSSFIGKYVENITKRGFIQIIFASKSYVIEYETISIHGEYTEKQPLEVRGIYDFLRNVPLGEPRMGEEVKLSSLRNKNLISFLEKYIKKLCYFQTFQHPSVYDEERKELVPSEDFIPLLTNINDEIVSFIYNYKNILSLVFPDIIDKSNFLLELLSNILPEIEPALFPYSTKFKWVESQIYYLPNFKDLLNEKKMLEDNYNKENLIIDDKIHENNKRFKFLHEILTETDDKLVKAVFSYFKWMEFENVIIMDEEVSKIKEEDLQIELYNGLLVIETKGIGGTSSDSDCSQISKIIHRRCEEREKFDVFGLYIVNHQRYLPPERRINPPFSENQIRDAKNEKRGLLTTWQLFKLYFDIQSNIITKEDAKEELIKYGLIEFKPKIKFNLGTPSHIYKDGHVIIMEVDNIYLQVGQELIAEKNGRFFKTIITSIKVNDKSVNEVKEFQGVVGLEVSSKISNGTTICF